jgi:hypothetical protein
MKSGALIDTNLPKPQRIDMALKPYTVFCRESNNTGTIWISTVLAESLEHTKSQGLAECCDDWNGNPDPEDADDFDHLHYTPDNVSVIGVAEGEVNILFWEDF